MYFMYSQTTSTTIFKIIIYFILFINVFVNSKEILYTLAPNQCSNGNPLPICNLTILTNETGGKLIGQVSGACCPGFNETHVNYLTWLPDYQSNIPITYTGYDCKGPFYIKYNTVVNGKPKQYNQSIWGFIISRTTVQRLGIFFYIVKPY